MMKKHPFYFGLAVGCIIVLCLKIMEERARYLQPAPGAEGTSNGASADEGVERAPAPQRRASTSTDAPASPQGQAPAAVAPQAPAAEGSRSGGPAPARPAPPSPSPRPSPAAAAPPAEPSAGAPGEGASEEEEGEEEEEQLIFSPDREGIRDSMSSQIGPEILECYQGWLAENPELEGRITIQFTIPPDGEGDDEESGAAEGVAVRDAELLVDDVAHPFLSGCLLNSVEGLRFEPPASGEALVVRYPFQFSR